MTTLSPHLTTDCSIYLTGAAFPLFQAASLGPPSGRAHGAPADARVGHPLHSHAKATAYLPFLSRINYGHFTLKVQAATTD